MASRPLSERLRRIRLRAVHKLTAHHWRHSRRTSGSRLGICSCGWKSRVFRPDLTTRARQVACLFLGHRWDKEPGHCEVGPAGFEDGEGDISWTMRQCERCYRCQPLSVKAKELPAPAQP